MARLRLWSGNVDDNFIQLRITKEHKALVEYYSQNKSRRLIKSLPSLFHEAAESLLQLHQAGELNSVQYDNVCHQARQLLKEYL